MNKYKIVSIGSLLGLSLLLVACSPESKAPETTIDYAGSVDSQALSMVVYKSRSCACCKDWVEYIRKAGFTVESVNHHNVNSIKEKHGLTDPSLKSCHTAIIDGYVIEGHVPVSDIERLLATRPAIVGLTAPGMPMMSPGMGSDTPQDYDVLAFSKNGTSRVYASY